MKKINEAETSEVESTNKSAPTENEVDPLTGELRDFDTTDSSEYDLDSVINLLAELRGKVANQQDEVEKIDLKQL